MLFHGHDVLKFAQRPLTKCLTAEMGGCPENKQTMLEYLDSDRRVRASLRRRPTVGDNGSKCWFDSKNLLSHVESNRAHFEFRSFSQQCSCSSIHRLSTVGDTDLRNLAATDAFLFQWCQSQSLCNSHLSSRVLDSADCSRSSSNSIRRFHQHLLAELRTNPSLRVWGERSSRQ